ncbi:MAG TPA: cell division protein FtsZ, partial [Dokdonella sp.]
NRAVARQPLRESRESREREVMNSPRPPMRVVRDGTTGQVLDYAGGLPGTHSRSAVEHAAQPEAAGDYLDIPAFLRRQAD